jgi:hypothetical protein
MDVVSRMGLEQLMEEDGLNYLDLIQFIKEKFEAAGKAAPISDEVITKHLYAVCKLQHTILTSGGRLK